MGVPSGALAGASVGVLALAGIVEDLTRGLPLPAEASTAAGATIRRIRRVSAPRVTALADVAAIAAELVATVRTVARAAEPADTSAGLYQAAAAARSAYPSSASPALTREYRLARIVAAGVEIACLGEAFLAEARTAFGDRRAATEARGRIAAALDGVTDRVASLLGQVAIGILSSAARECSGHLVRLAADLQPIVRAETPISYPSTALAWSLYGDPARAVELVARNRCGTPLFMPTLIEAVSPKA